MQIKDKKNDSSNDLNFFQSMTHFLENGEKKIEKLSHLVNTEIEKIRVDLASFFCEEEDQFKLEECFTVLCAFYQRFKLAMEENDRRRDSEIKLKERQKNKNFENRKLSISDHDQSGSEIIGHFQDRGHESNAKDSIEDELHNGLIELLRTTSDIGASSGDSMYGSLRRVGSGRRTRIKIDALKFDESSRERVPNEKQFPLYYKIKNPNSNSTIAKIAEDVVTDEQMTECNLMRVSAEFEPPVEERVVVCWNGKEERKEKKRVVKDKEKEFSSFQKLSCIKAKLESQLSGPKDNILAFNESERKRYSHEGSSEKMWNIKDNFKPAESMDISSSKTVFNSSQPLAIIAPTKKDKEQLVHPKAIKLNSEAILLKEKKPSVTAAVYVTPVQLAEKKANFNSKVEMDTNSNKSLKSKLPIKKSLFNASPKLTFGKSSIPFRQENDTRKNQYKYYTSIHKNLNHSQSRPTTKNGAIKNITNHCEPKSWMRQTKSSAQRIICRTNCN